MTSDEDFLRRSFTSLEVDAEFTEAVLLMSDGSRLHFCHRVGERRAQVVSAGEGEGILAGQILSKLATFRLNARHLDIHFEDGSRWEARFGEPRKAR